MRPPTATPQDRTEGLTKAQKKQLLARKKKEEEQRKGQEALHGLPPLPVGSLKPHPLLAKGALRRIESIVQQAAFTVREPEKLVVVERAVRADSGHQCEGR